MEINIDDIIYLSWEGIAINATLVFSWIVILLLVFGSFFLTRSLSPGITIGKTQALIESLIDMIIRQIKESTQTAPERYLPFIGTLFLYIVTSNVLGVVPGFYAPTASISTTAALASCVFIAVPVFGIIEKGFIKYVQNYIQPTPFMLPFNIIGELSRTLALAIRLFGNIMSGSLIVAILLSLSPLFFPVIMQAFSLLIGVIQAYVFAILAMVYIASAARGRRGIQEEVSKTQ